MQFHGLQGKARISEKRPKRALEELGFLEKAFRKRFKMVTRDFKGILRGVCMDFEGILKAFERPPKGL